MLEKCHLCGQKTKLVRSHVIPKFFYNYIKETSATGKLRQALNKERRIQDGIKEYLYCRTCENIFSRLEEYFASNVFYPYVRNQKDTFRYNQNLKKFIVSLSWRILDNDLMSWQKKNEKLAPHVLSAYGAWKDYLLGKTDSVVCETHMFFLSEIEDAPPEVHKQLEWYFCRATDGTIASSINMVFVYCLVPKVMFVTTIYPRSLPEFERTLVDNEGTISTKQNVTLPGFYDFLLSRAKMASLTDQLSVKEQKKIIATISKNPLRFINSESAKIIYSRLKRKKIEVTHEAEESLRGVQGK